MRKRMLRNKCDEYNLRSYHFCKSSEINAIYNKCEKLSSEIAFNAQPQLFLHIQ